MAGYNAYKVMMVSDTVGGVWTYSMELCKALQEYNVQVHLITTGAKLQQWQWREAEKLNHVQVYESDFMLEWMHNPWDDIAQSGRWLLELEDELQPDVIHLNCYCYGSLPFRAPKVIVAHSDVYSWFKAVKNELPPAQWSEYYGRVRAGLQHPMQ